MNRQEWLKSISKVRQTKYEYLMLCNNATLFFTFRYHITPMTYATISVSIYVMVLTNISLVCWNYRVTLITQKVALIRFIKQLVNSITFMCVQIFCPLNVSKVLEKYFLFVGLLVFVVYACSNTLNAFEM